MTLCRLSKMTGILSQIDFRFPVSWRLGFRKAKNFAYQISTRYLNPVRDITTSSCWKQTSAILKFYCMPVSILTSSPSSLCDSAPAYQILYELEDRRQSYDVMSIFQDGGHTVANLLLPFWGMVTSHVSEGTNLFAYQNDQMSQSTADILLLPLSNNKRSPYWNSASGFHIDLFIAVGMWFCISLPNFFTEFCHTRWSPTKLWRHIDFATLGL